MGHQTVQNVAAQEVSEPAPKVVLIEARINWTEERIIKEIRDTFHEDPDTAEAVARCESRLDRNVVNPKNGSFDTGIFQISRYWHGWEIDQLGLDMTDPGDNIAYARTLYERNGWQDWLASKHCWRP